MKAFRLLGETREWLAKQGKKRFTRRELQELRAKERYVNAGLPNLVSWDPFTLYDRNTGAAAAATSVQYDFFVQPIGQNSKTKVDTNMTLVMQLPSPERFDIHKIGFELNPDIINADALGFFNNYYWELWVGNRSYAEGPLAMAMSKTGLWTSGAGAAGTANTNFTSLGMPLEAEGGFDVRLPPGLVMRDPVTGAEGATNGLTGIGIGEQQSFQVKLIGTSFTLATAGSATWGTGFKMRCYLKGMKSRQAS